MSDPLIMQVLANAHKALQAGDLGQAEVLSRRGLEINPQNPRARELLGVIFANRKNFSEAIPLLRRALDLQPGNGALHLTLGRSLLATGQLFDAKTSIQTSLSLRPDDPVAHWQEIYEEQEKLIKWLAGKKSITIRGPHVDITMSIEGRTFINSSGNQNMPSGEIFTSPVEDSVNGFVYPVSDNQRLEKCMKYMVTNSGKLAEMGIVSGNLIKEHTPEIVSGKIAKSIKRIMDHE